MDPNYTTNPISGSHQPSALTQQMAMTTALTSPIQTRARAKQMHMAALYTSTGTQLIKTTIEYAYVPETTPRMRYFSPKVITSRMSRRKIIQHPNTHRYLLIITKVEMPTTNSERRFGHIGPTDQGPSVQRQVEELQRQIQILSSKQRASNVPPNVTTATFPPQMVSIVSREPVFPTRQLRTYAEHEKLKGQSNYQTWRRMMLRDLRTSNLIAFIESPIRNKTSWTESTRHHGDAVA